MRISAPTYTQTPNDLFDHWLPLLNEGELKVLLVIMRKTFGWHKTHDVISVSQLSKYTGMMEETVIKSAKSLQNKGVITREVSGPIGKQQTKYSLVVNEDSNNSYPSVQSRTPLGSNPPVQTEAQKKENYKEKIKQQQAAPPAAVFSDQSNKKKKDLQVSQMLKNWELLKIIDIPEKDKDEISTKYDEETVKNAIAWATNPQTMITKTLAAAIKWACQNNPEVPKNKEEIEQVHKDYAFKYDGLKSSVAEIICCNKHVEIVHGGAASTGVFLSYDSKDFMTVFKQALKMNHFRILE